MIEFTAKQKSLYNSNLKLFRQKMPDVVNVIDVNIPANIELYRSDEEIDVLINDQRFYGADAVVYAGQQVAAFLEKPGILESGAPGADDKRTPTHLAWLKKYDRAFKTKVTAVSIDRCRVDPATTMLFGVGLGFHILPLVAHSRCRELVIFEPEPVFVKLSMYFIDWKKIFKILKYNIGFIFERDPETAFRTLRYHTYARNPGVHQCITYYQHYYADGINSVFKYCMEKFHLVFDGLGYYDDEKLMLEHHLLNSYKASWHMCNPRKTGEVATAVIVGAGPSLMRDIDWLKKNSDNLIIFSAGSSLQALLTAGITPDFHVEIENIKMNYELLKPLADKYDISKVVLIASSTMDPMSVRLFKRVLWFMREGVMSTVLLGSDLHALPGQNPTVVNTALSAALTLYFRRVLLLGADFGTRNAEEHHVKGTSYETHDELKSVQFKFPDQIDANFGGKCWTNVHMMNGIKSTQSLLDLARAAQVYNGSDGAYVPRTIPMQTSRFKVEPLSIKKSGIIDRIYDSSEIADWNKRESDDLFDRLANEFAEYCNVIGLISTKTSRSEKDFVRYLSKFYFDILHDERCAKYNPMVAGSITSVTIIIMHWWRRVYSDELSGMESVSRRYLKLFLSHIGRDFKKFMNSVRQELPLVRPELFDDKGNLIVEAKSSAQNAE